MLQQKQHIFLQNDEKFSYHATIKIKKVFLLFVIS